MDCYHQIEYSILFSFRGKGKMLKNRVAIALLERVRRFYCTAPIDTALWALHSIELIIYTIFTSIEHFLFGFPPFLIIARTVLFFLALRALPIIFFEKARKRYGSTQPHHLQLSKICQAWTFVSGYINFIVLYSLLQPLDRFITPLLEKDWFGLRSGWGSRADSPVLLVHGFCCNSMFWLPVRAYLHWHGVRNVFSISLSPCLGDIAAYARAISNKVDVILESTGAEQLVIVGHSMGGIAARHYIHKLNGFSKVEKLIALASPHKGTQLANWSPLKLLKLERSCILQMARGSTFLDEINKMEISKQAWKVPVTNIFSYDDDIVLPQESSILNVAHEKCIACSGMSHLSMPFSRKINRLVFKELRGRALKSFKPIAPARLVREIPVMAGNVY